MTAERKRRLAVVLFNLGGPDGPAAVRPFLFNLFADKAIIGLPWPVRMAVATLVSSLRAKGARANYDRMGGGSPLIPETRAQAEALQADLAARLPQTEARVFIAMRYWAPMSPQTAKEVAAYEPDEVVLLPLYPQFSTTTTGSSMKAWKAAYKGPGRVRTVCCYPSQSDLVKAHADKIVQTWKHAGSPWPIRLLFSAHGLPESVIAKGDPYQAQVEATAVAVVERLRADHDQTWDWRVCYQSRVGPMKWIGPYTIAAIEEAGSEGLGVLITPIAFVSEHIETLVELDHDYANLAEQVGCPAYLRVPALGVTPGFIDGLGQIVAKGLASRSKIDPAGPWRCSAAWTGCPKLKDQAA